MNRIGIRSEEKHWDSRASVSPKDICRLPSAIDILFQSDGERRPPFKPRVFSDDELLKTRDDDGARASIVQSLEDCAVIIGTKEIKEVFVALTETEATGLLGIAPQLAKEVSYFDFDAGLGLARLTDFLRDSEKELLLYLCKESAFEEKIRRLIEKQDGLIAAGKTYLFFTHTHKGQAYNMRMLRRLMDLNCTLLDYELLTEMTSSGPKRTVAYGPWAGIVGVLETLFAYGQHLESHAGMANPFTRIHSESCYDAAACEFKSLQAIRSTLSLIAGEVAEGKAPLPVIIGVSGFRGEAGGGILTVLEDSGLPTQVMSQEEFGALTRGEFVPDRRIIYLVKLDYDALYRPRPGVDLPGLSIRQAIQAGKGHLLESNADRFFPYLSIFLNCIFWNRTSPRILSNSYLKQLFHTLGQAPALPVIGDISCDPSGSIECCRDTYPNAPAFVWCPDQSEVPISPDFDMKKTRANHKYFDLRKRGFVVMAVTNLPCELPRESSQAFSHDFCQARPELGGKSYIECLAEADFTADFEDCGLPAPLRDAVILYQGRFHRGNKQLQLKDIALAMLESDNLTVDEVLPMVP